MVKKEILEFDISKNEENFFGPNQHDKNYYN